MVVLTIVPDAVILQAPCHSETQPGGSGQAILHE
jgi:hypothetical protein